MLMAYKRMRATRLQKQSMFSRKKRGTVHPEPAEITALKGLVAFYAEENRNLSITIDGCRADLDEVSGYLGVAREKNDALAVELGHAKKTIAESDKKVAALNKTIADMRRSPCAEVKRLKDKHNVEMRKMRDDIIRNGQLCDGQLVAKDDEMQKIRVAATRRIKAIQAEADLRVHDADIKAAMPMEEAKRMVRLEMQVEKSANAVLKQAQAAELKFLDDDEQTLLTYTCGVCRRTNTVEGGNTSVYTGCGHCICTSCVTNWSKKTLATSGKKFTCPTCNKASARAFPVFFP